VKTQQTNSYRFCGLCMILDEFSLAPPSNADVREVPPIFDIPLATVNEQMFGRSSLASSTATVATTITTTAAAAASSSSSQKR
jgi:hypothetical protein